MGKKTYRLDAMKHIDLSWTWRLLRNEPVARVIEMKSRAAMDVAIQRGLRGEDE